jgi:hypothetical protein
MDDKILTSQTKKHGVWMLDAGANSLDLHDAINAKLLQTCSLTSMVTAPGFEAFNSWNDELKSNYLWALSNSVDELRMLFDAFVEKSSNGVPNVAL